MDRVWALAADGYRIVDVDSDEHFVGIRMERGGRSLTLLLTREDFIAAFPNADALPLEADYDAPEAYAEDLAPDQ